ncbi:zinc knuckle CX2CX4HX4C containing protein [Tanacetum coccineum]
MIQEKAVEYVRALNTAPLEVVFAGPFDIGVDKVSSAIDDVFDIGEARGVDKDELNTVISVLKDGGGEFNDCLDEINLDLSQEFVIRVPESRNDGACNSKKIIGSRNLLVYGQLIVVMAQPDNNNTLSSAFKTFFEREKLTGDNFNDWYRSLRIVLRVAGTYDYLFKPCPEEPPEDAAENVKAAWKAEYKIHSDVACLMLGRMSPALQRQFELYFPQAMLDELRRMFEKPKAVEIYDLVDTLHSCKQAPGKSITLYYTICALNDKNTNQLAVNKEQLQNDMSNDDNEEIGKSQEDRVHESESDLKNDNTDKKKNVECDCSMEKESNKQDEYDLSNVDGTQSNNPINVSPISMQVNVQSDTVKTCMENYDEKMSNKSYAKKVINNEIVDNKLSLIPTVMNESGQEFVIFNEEMVLKGSKKWELTAFRYFVGYKMTIQELRYHLYMMWSNFRLKHILNNGNGIFVFKFDNNQGLQTVIEIGPWIVNNKPMVVQKWDPSINLDRTEPCTLPLWIKLMNQPLEA